MPDLTTLIGEMANLRYLIGYSVNYSDRFNIEQALLCKYRVFNDMLNKAGADIPYPKGYEDQFDIYPIVEKVKSMSLVEVETYLKKMEEAAWDWHEKYNEEERQKKGPEVDTLFGSKPRTEDELLKLIDIATDKEVYTKAQEELNNAHGCYYGPDWKDLIKEYPQATKVGFLRAYKEHQAASKKAKKKKRKVVNV